MVSEFPPRVKRKKSKRPVPRGQKLLMLFLLSGICCFLTVSLFQPHPNSAQSSSNSSSANAQTLPVLPPPFKLTEPLEDLNKLLLEHVNKPNLNTGVFVVEPDTGRFVEIDAHRAYPAASMIKLPILVRLLQAVDKGQVKFDQMLAIRQDLIGGGSGCLQWRKAGSPISLKETCELMIVVSDNTATNMVIDVLGGKEVFNQDFAKWGLNQTHINNWLPDLAGTNTSSPYDLSLVLGRVDRGELLSAKSRAWLFNVLEHNRIKTLLPRGVPAGTKVADKTGDIGKVVGDAGIITTKDGKRYIATVIVERPYNDRRANALIRRVSKDVYIGVTGDTVGAKSVVVDDEQKQVAQPQRRHGRRRRHK